MKNIFDVLDEVNGKKNDELNFEEIAQIESLTNPIYLAQNQYKLLYELNSQLKEILKYLKRISFIIVSLFLALCLYGLI